MPLKKALFVTLICLASPCPATDFSDPSWPCVQRKVERLSLGLMWPQPVPQEPLEDKTLSKEIQALASKLAIRRIDIDDLRADVQDFAQRHDGDSDLLGRVFESVFKSLSGRRTQIINGIGDFSLSQITLSEKIETARTDMDTELAATAPDYDKIDALEEQLDWDQLIYSDRQKSITYLCETPVLLEKRLYALAQLLQYEIREE